MLRKTQAEKLGAIGRNVQPGEPDSQSLINRAGAAQGGNVWQPSLAASEMFLR